MSLQPARSSWLCNLCYKITVSTNYRCDGRRNKEIGSGGEGEEEEEEDDDDQIY